MKRARRQQDLSIYVVVYTCVHMSACMRHSLVYRSVQEPALCQLLDRVLSHGVRQFQRLVLYHLGPRGQPRGLRGRFHRGLHRLYGRVLLHLSKLEIRIFERPALHLTAVPELVCVLVEELVGLVELATDAGHDHADGLATGADGGLLDLKL